MDSLSEKNEYDNAVVSIGYIELFMALEFTICNWEAICDDDCVDLDFTRSCTESIYYFKAIV